MYIIPPGDLEFVIWANKLLITLPDYAIPNPQSVDEWRKWALKVISNNNMSNAPKPVFNLYPENDDWKKWATQFIKSING